MAGSLWALVGLNSLAASVLIVAGIAKLVSPRQLLRALQELLTRRDRGPAELTTGALRVFAVIELAAAVALLVARTRAAAGLLVGVLGLCFALFGTAGWLRRSRTACGCLGRYGDRPLGLGSAVVGLAIASVLPFNQLAGLPAADGRAYAERAVVATALGSLALCVWANRRLVLTLLRPTGTSARTVTR